MFHCILSLPTPPTSIHAFILYAWVRWCLKYRSHLSCLMKWLAYTQVHLLQNLSQRHDFTRMCFHHSSGSKDHQCLLIPSLSALRLHVMLWCFQNIFVMQYNSISCECMWRIIKFSVWDKEVNRLKAGKGYGCKAASVMATDGSGAGCRNCFHMCRPCSMKCTCKLRCRIITAGHVKGVELLM